MKPIQRKRGTTIRARMSIRARITLTLAAIARDLRAEIDKTEKAAKSKRSETLNAIVVRHFEDDQLFHDYVRDQLAAVATDGVSLAMAQISVSGDVALSQANDASVAWADEHAGELIRGLSKTTRDTLQDLVGTAEEEGWSNATLADELESNFGFSRNRADMVARTETATADVEGNKQAYQASGQVDQWQWITAADDNVSDECEMNSDEIRDIGDAFPSGATQPPGHPRCRCDCIPILRKDDSEEDES